MPHGFVGWLENENNSLSQHLSNAMHDVTKGGNMIDKVNNTSGDIVHAAEGIPGQLNQWRGDAVTASEHALSDIGFGPDPNGQGTIAKKPTVAHEKSLGADNPFTNKQAVQSATSAILQPQQDQLNNIESQFAQSMGTVDLPKTGNAKLDAALAAEQTAQQKGMSGELSAMQAEAKVPASVASSIPYTDVIAATLGGRKSQLLYGYTPGPADTTGWQNQVKGIYDWIEGINKNQGTPGGGVPLPGLGGGGNSNSPGVTNVVGGPTPVSSGGA